MADRKPKKKNLNKLPQRKKKRNHCGVSGECDRLEVSRRSVRQV